MIGSLSALVDGEHIKKSPFEVRVKPGGTAVEKTTLEQRAKAAGLEDKLVFKYHALGARVHDDRDPILDPVRRHVSP